MLCRVSDLILDSASAHPDAAALAYGREQVTYEALAEAVQAMARSLVGLGQARGDRVAVYLEKRIETLVALFGAAAAGCAFVPINPQLKPRQVAHILADSGASALVTSRARLAALAPMLSARGGLAQVILVDGTEQAEALTGVTLVDWNALSDAAPFGQQVHPATLADMAAILYTSGSTGLPKGVVLSHQNLVIGAQSVASYLENRPEDRLLSLLPLSFDAGLSQATTAFSAGAKLVLMNYLLPGRRAEALCGGRHYRDHRRAAALDSPGRARLARGGGVVAALFRQHRRPPAARRARQAARAFAERQALSHVRADRGLPLDLSRSGAGRRTARFDGQGDSQRRDPGAAPRRQPLRCGGAGRVGASRAAGGDGLLERCRAHRRALPAPAAARIRRDSAGNCRLLGRPGTQGRRRLPLLHRARRRDDQDLGLPG